MKKESKDNKEINEEILKSMKDVSIGMWQTFKEKGGQDLPYAAGFSSIARVLLMWDACIDHNHKEITVVGDLLVAAAEAMLYINKNYESN